MMARRIVGVDIGTQAINTVQVRFGSTQRTTLENYLEFAIYRGVDENGLVKDVEEIAAYLKQLWLIAGYQTKKIALGFGNPTIFVREFSIPWMPAANIRAALPGLAEGILPLPSSELILDFYPISENNNDGEKSVDGLLLAANKKGVENLVAAAELAGLSVESIDLIPFAVLRYFYAKEKPDGTTALIYATGGMVTILISTSGVPQFIRIIPIGSSQNITTPQQASGDEVDNAIEPNKGYVEEPTLRSRPEIYRITNMLESIDSRQSVIREISDTLNYYKSLHADNPVTQIQMVGYSLNEKTFLSDLEHKISTPIHSLLKSPLGHKKDLVTLVGNVETADELIVALSLALGAKA